MCEEGIQGEVFLKTENQSEELCTELSTCHRARAGAEPGEGRHPPPHLTLSTHQEREQSLGKDAPHPPPHLIHLVPLRTEVLLDDLALEDLVANSNHSVGV